VPARFPKPKRVHETGAFTEVRGWHGYCYFTGKMRLGRRLGWVMGLGAWHLAACGSVTEHHGTAAAGTSTGDSAQSAAGTGGGGDGGATGGSGEPITTAGIGGTTGDALCVRDLNEYCSAPGRCPNSPDEVAGFCSFAETVTKAQSSCGGTSVLVTAGLGRSAWHFDAAGKLVGASVSGDTSNACFNGITTYYGKICLTEGLSPNICPLECGTASVCNEAPDRFLDCPKDYASYKASCNARGGVDIVEYDSSCGGKIIEASDGVQSEWWTFSASGQLVGTLWAGDVGDSDCWGKPCELVGKGREICQGGAGNEGGAPSGGAAGNDAGGAGGAP
jgi:hypothetical protein